MATIYVYVSTQYAYLRPHFTFLKIPQKSLIFLVSGLRKDFQKLSHFHLIKGPKLIFHWSVLHHHIKPLSRYKAWLSIEEVIGMSTDRNR